MRNATNKTLWKNLEISQEIPNRTLIRSSYTIMRMGMQTNIPTMKKWRFLKNPQIELPYDTVTSLPGIDSKERKLLCRRNRYIIYCSCIQNSQDMQSNQLFNKR